MKAQWFRAYFPTLLVAVDSKALEVGHRIDAVTERIDEQLEQYEQLPWYSRLLVCKPRSGSTLDWSEDEWRLYALGQRHYQLVELRQKIVKAEEAGAASLYLNDDEIRLIN